MAPLWRPMRSSTASTSSTGDRLPPRRRSTSSAAGARTAASMMGTVGIPPGGASQRTDGRGDYGRWERWRAGGSRGMRADEAIEVIRSQHRAVLATTRGDGGVQMSPVAVVPDDDGTLLISSRETAMKVKN